MPAGDDRTPERREDWTDIFRPVAPIDELGFYALRQILEHEACGFWLAVEPQTFGRARIGISALRASTAAEAFKHGYADVFDYDSVAMAIAAMALWSGVGEPLGWSRHFGTARRRQQDGTLLVRMTEIPPILLEQLRENVRHGASHECAEWEAERGGRATRVCALCDRPIDRELSTAEASAALDRAFKSVRDNQEVSDGKTVSENPSR